jgi:uncharacterized membrane protein
MHWQNFYPMMGLGDGMGSFSLLLLIMWSLVWKGLALWKAARKGSKPWFVALLVINTVGILEILYLYVFSKKGEPVESHGHEEHHHEEHHKIEK